MAIQLHLSGGSNNTDPKGALGGVRSSSQITSDTLENLFDDITRTETLTGKTEFRCFYVYNPSGNPFTNSRVRIKTHPATSNVFIGADLSGKGDGQLNGVATTIATEDATPTGVIFYGESEDRVEIPCGLLEAGESHAVWLKRTAEAGSAQTISFTLRVDEDAGTLPSTSVADNIGWGEHLDCDKAASGTLGVGTGLIGFAEVG